MKNISLYFTLYSFKESLFFHGNPRPLPRPRQNLVHPGPGPGPGQNTRPGRTLIEANVDVTDLQHISTIINH